MNDLNTIEGEIVENKFDDITLVIDLIYYDGPLLSHVKDNFEIHYLFFWVDYDTELNRWLIIESDFDWICKLVRGEISLLDLINKSAGLFIGDLDGRLTYKKLKKVRLENIPSEYLPEMGWKFQDEVPAMYSTQTYGIIIGNIDIDPKNTLNYDTNTRPINTIRIRLPKTRRSET